MKRIKQKSPRKVIKTNETNVNESVTRDQIIFRIEDEHVTCSKKLLVEHSDYFKVLLNGDFSEKNKEIIDLNGVTSGTMTELIGILQERELFSRCEDVYGVLAACEMFLFEELKTWILKQLELGLNTSNCLRTWHELEPLGMDPLWWRAKSLSLMYFHEILDNDSVNCLNFDELFRYLGNINLTCENEIEVFKVALEWYHRHPDSESKFKQLMRCIGFKQASVNDVIGMRDLLGLDEAPNVRNILNHVIRLRTEKNEDCSGDDSRFALELLQSRSRFVPKAPCFLVKSSMKELDNDSEDSQCYEVVYYDKYRRKRRHTVIRDKSRERIVYYDHRAGSLQEFSHIPVDKCTNLTGFGIQGYKTKILIFGGEFSLGRGTWNMNTWLFDTGPSKLEQKQTFPSPRRHFESCVCGHYVYVVGGTGSFRVIQDNMFSYDLKADRWRDEVILPCSGKQVKCCNFNGKLFIFSFSDKCGYVYDQDTNHWKKIVINDTDGKIPKTFTLFTVFFHHGNLFLKGDKLIELEMLDDTFVVSKVVAFATRHHVDFIESFTSHNYCYTLYKYELETGGGTGTLLEYLDLETLETKFVYEDSGVQKMFLLHHHSLVVDDTFVN